MYFSDTPMTVEGVRFLYIPYISLIDAYYIPTLTLNLASVSQLSNSGNWVFLFNSICVIHDQHIQKVIRILRWVREIYVLEVLKVSDVSASNINFSFFHLSALPS